jgi:hypothetical protein
MNGKSEVLFDDILVFDRGIYLMHYSPEDLLLHKPWLGWVPTWNELIEFRR